MDIKQIISELNTIGRLPQWEIASKCGCSQSTVNKLLNGKVSMNAASHGTIVKLIELHAKLVKNRKRY